MRRPRVSALVLALLVLSIPMLGAAAEFSLSLQNGIDVPDRTVTIEDSTFTVSSISQFSQGDTLTVDTNAPDGEAYDIYIYGVDDGSHQVIDTKYVDADSDGTVSFDTSAFDAGSYVASIYHDGTYYDPQPFVIAGYDLTLSLSDQSAERGDTVDLTITTTATASTGSPASVEFVIGNGDTITRIDATRTDGRYTATLSLDDYTPGDYRVYGVAHSTEDAPDGNKEIVAITSSTTLSVTASATATPTATDSNSGGSSATTTQTPTTSQPTSTSTTSVTPTSTANVTNTPTTTPTDVSSTPTVTSTPTDSRPTSSATSSSVIRPNGESTQPADGGMPGVVPWIVGSLFATFAVGWLLHARGGE